MSRILGEHAIFELNGIDQTELAGLAPVAVYEYHVGPEMFDQ
jgi:hypothetical protein